MNHELRPVVCEGYFFWPVHFVFVLLWGCGFTFNGFIQSSYDASFNSNLHGFAIVFDDDGLSELIITWIDGETYGEGCDASKEDHLSEQCSGLSSRLLNKFLTFKCIELDITWTPHIILA